jgi:hypothetical protein
MTEDKTSKDRSERVPWPGHRIMYDTEYARDVDRMNSTPDENFKLKKKSEEQPADLPAPISNATDKPKVCKEMYWPGHRIMYDSDYARDVS